ncbi:MAG: FliA/WhiG family RNA polymerase sigma factor [Candidatus Korobacteraceae bacterium]|jgi:RNA polymerase sigma factor FliA
MGAAQVYEQINEPAVGNSDQLLLEQLPQVKYIARRIHERLPQHVAFDDLLHAGIVGLIDALHKYDARKNVRFASYAKFRIRGAILDSLRDMDWSPRDLRRKARRLETVMQKLQTELGRSAGEPELAQAMGMTLEEFQHLLDELRGLEVGSLQIELREDGREADLSESIAGPTDQDPLSLYMRVERKQMLAGAIAQLPPREQQVLALYYQEELTMKEVGAVLGVGESRVSQIHSVAVARLRATLCNARQESEAGRGAAVAKLRCRGANRATERVLTGR